MTLENLAGDLRKIHFEKGAISVIKRRQRLGKLKAFISNYEEKINLALKTDLGKSAFESYATEVGFILEELSYTLKNLEKWADYKKVGTPLSLFPGKSYIYPEPYGVVLIIAPWNYPFQLSLAPLIGAIAAGNRVILKPSELSPETSSVIKELVSAVFTPEEVQVVEGGLEETQSLLRQKMDYIFFTGSTTVGKVIMKAAAETLTPVTLELGGKSPCLIEESADLDIAAKRIVWGKFINAGQTCVAPDFVLVPKHKQERLIKKIRSYIESFYKDPQSSPDYPRIVNEKHFDRLVSQILPEKVVVGGESNREQKFISPTIMKDVTWSDKVMEDEIFGPILPLVPYENLDELLNKLVEQPKPLAFYLFSEDPARSEAIIKKLPFGGGCINDTVVHLANPNLPFGGVGASGMGSYHGKKSFETFTHYKAVFEQNTKVDIPVRYPPYEGKLSWLKFFIR
jgi:aldehyde dehydrogenase (NAD+)